jgi:hypothetical protein
MSVQITVEIPDEVYATLRQRAAAERTSIGSLITFAIERRFRPQPIAARDGAIGGKEG